MIAHEWFATSLHKHGVGVLNVAEITGTIERMKAGVDEFRRVADVMQPCGGFE